VVRVLLHPLLITEPIEQTGVTDPLQTSVAVAVPQPGIVPGLQPKSEPAGHEVNTGGLTSTTHVNVCVQVEELRQASVAV
jgi:hypothetical protein